MAKAKKKVEEVTTESRVNKIVQAYEKMSKGEGQIMVLGDDAEIKDVPVIPSGVFSLDRILGVGGYPQGRIIEISGLESSGKTTLTLQAIASAQKHGGICAFVDAEHCLKEGTLVYDADSFSYRPIEELYLEGKTFSVLSVSKDKSLIKQKAKVKKEGKRKVFNIKTKYGRSIFLTDNHKVLTLEGYKLVSELSLDDVLLTPSSFDSNTVEPYSEKDVSEDLSLYRLLGLHLGDGSCDTTDISNVDSDVISDIKAIVTNLKCSVTKNGNYNWRIKQNFKKKKYNIEKEELERLIKDGYILSEMAIFFGCSKSTIVSRLKEYGIYDKVNWRVQASSVRNKKRKIVEFNNDSSVFENSIKNDVYLFLNKFECFSKNSKDRSIPINLRKEELAQVLAGYFLADGTVVDSDNQKRCHASISTSSRRLALDIQSSLLRFGIFSSLSSSKKEDYDLNYRIAINGVSNFSKFLYNIPIYGYKKDRMLKAISSSSKSYDRKKYYSDFFVEAPILHINEEEGEFQTYDVSVCNLDFFEQNFIAEGLVVHNSLDTSYAAKLGVDFNKLLLSQPDSGEAALTTVENLAELLGPGDIIVVDSVAALTPKAELDGEMGDSQIGLQARLMSKAMRKLTGIISKNSVTLIFINQIRQKIGISFGSNETTPGGNALKFYASIRLDIRKIGQIKNSNGDIIGSKTRIKAIKNKVAPPFRQVEVDLRFGEGIPRVNDILDLAIAEGLVQKSGAWFSMNDTNIGQGKEKTIEYLKENPLVVDELEQKLRDIFLSR